MSWLAAKKYPMFCQKFTYSIQNYEIEIKIDPRKRMFKANVSLTLTAGKNTRQFCFLLSNNCTLTNVNYLGIALTHSINSAHPGQNLITTVLPRKASVGEKLVIAFIYSGDIPTHDGESIELPPDIHWYPYSLRPQKYTCTLKVITPESTRIVASGKFIREQPADIRVMTQWSAHKPFRGIHMIAGDLLKTTRETQPNLEVYYPRNYMNQGKVVANQSLKILDFLAEKLGPSPAPSATIVLTDHPDISTVSSFYLTSISGGTLEKLKEYQSSKERTINLFQIIARELAHRWLKHNLVVAHPWHLWYLDGLAEYLSWLALEEEYGKATREQTMQKARATVLAAPKECIQSEACGISKKFPPWLVSKASWIMWTAHCLAEDSFLPALMDFYARCPEIAPSSEEFFLTMGKMTGTDMSQLFKEWACTDDQLRTEVVDPRTFQDDEGQWQLVFTLTNTGKLFWPHPIDIKMKLADGSSLVHSLLIQNEPHLIETPAKILTLTVDPEMKVLNWAEKNTYKL